MKRFLFPHKWDLQELVRSARLCFQLVQVQGSFVLYLKGRIFSPFSGFNF